MTTVIHSSSAAPAVCDDNAAPPSPAASKVDINAMPMAPAPSAVVCKDINAAASAKGKEPDNEASSSSSSSSSPHGDIIHNTTATTTTTNTNMRKLPFTKETSIRGGGSSTSSSSSNSSSSRGNGGGYGYHRYYDEYWRPNYSYRGFNTINGPRMHFTREQQIPAPCTLWPLIPQQPNLYAAPNGIANPFSSIWSSQPPSPPPIAFHHDVYHYTTLSHHPQAQYYRTGAPPPPSFVPYQEIHAAAQQSEFSAKLDDLRARLRKQIEYYFSSVNLCTDNYLKKHMDCHGLVPITLIATFRKVQKLMAEKQSIFDSLRSPDVMEVQVNPLTNNEQFILDSLRLSDIVEVQGDRIRTRHEWEKWILPQTVTHSSVKSGNQSQTTTNN